MYSPSRIQMSSSTRTDANDAVFEDRERPCCPCVVKDSPPVVQKVYWSLFGTMLGVGLVVLIVGACLLGKQTSSPVVSGVVLTMLGCLLVLSSGGPLAAAISARKVKVLMPDVHSGCVPCLCENMV